LALPEAEVNMDKTGMDNEDRVAQALDKIHIAAESEDDDQLRAIRQMIEDYGKAKWGWEA
jgi:hypothetical protein